MKIIITGGHLTPALAVIEELQNEGKNRPSPKILFVGRKYPLEGESTLSQEYNVINQMEGITFVSLTAGRLQRKFTRFMISSLLKIPIGFLQALWIVGKFRPNIILSFGGYVALPVVIAGWLYRIPIVTHEQTVVSGLANKIISRFARKICVSWPVSMANFPKGKAVLTGNPLRREIFKVNKNSQRGNSPFPMIYITGGSLGSHWINEAVSERLSNLLEKYIVIHQSGDSQKYCDYKKLQNQKEKFKTDLQKRYFLTPYVGSEDIGWVMEKADLIISRAGANTITELAALGKPAILIPIPWSSNNEQTKNAKFLVDNGGAEILPQKDLSGEKLDQQITEMLKNLPFYKKRAERAKKFINLSAAREITGVINEIYSKSQAA